MPDAAPVSVRNRDFRFDPATRAFEAITGTVQFGNTFDDWGNRFLCSESHPLSHAVLPQEYLERNPYLPVPSAIHDVAGGSVPIFRITGFPFVRNGLVAPMGTFTFTRIQ